MSRALSSDLGDRVSLDRAAERVGVDPSVLRGWLAPADDGYRPHEVEWLRAVRRLDDGDLPKAAVRRALTRLRDRWGDDEAAPTELRRIGSHLVVSDEAGEWSAENGQEWLPLLVPGEPRRTGQDDPEAAADDRRVALVVDLDEARRRRAAAGVGRAAPGEEVHGADSRASRDDREAASLYQEVTDESDPDRAIELLRRVVELDAAHVEARLDLGALLHERGEVADAERQYRAALRLEPDNATAWFDLGVALEDQQRDRPALEAYRRSLELDAGDPDVWFNTSRLLERLGDRAGAIAHLARCHQLRREVDS